MTSDSEIPSMKEGTGQFKEQSVEKIRFAIRQCIRGGGIRISRIRNSARSDVLPSVPARQMRLTSTCHCLPAVSPLAVRKNCLGRRQLSHVSCPLMQVWHARDDLACFADCHLHSKHYPYYESYEGHISYLFLYPLELSQHRLPCVQR